MKKKNYYLAGIIGGGIAIGGYLLLQNHSKQPVEKNAPLVQEQSTPPVKGAEVVGGEENLNPQPTNLPGNEGEAAIQGFKPSQ